MLGREPGQRLHRAHGLRRHGSARRSTRPTAAGPFAHEPRRAHLHDRPDERDETRAEPARHRAERRRHARVRHLPDDPRRDRRRSRRATRSLQRVRSSELPTDALGLSILRGKIDFFTSRPFWSDRGWGGCWSCHPDGRTDNVTWSFEAGPRQTISLDGTFSSLEHSGRPAPAQLDAGARREPGFRAEHARHLRRPWLHRHATPTSTADGHHARFRSQRPELRPRQLRTARCSRPTSRTGSRFGVRSAIAPPSTSGDPAHGRTIFGSAAPNGANCVACHSGVKWTTSRVTYDPADVNPVPGTDTGIVNLPDVLSVFLNGFNSTAGAGRACEVPPPPCAAERVRIVRQVGTLLGHRIRSRSVTARSAP